MFKSKKFDKKKAVTFQLVHRSQQDPLVADENAPQRILVPVENKEGKKNKVQIEEQQKYGILYDDEFNYLERLKDVKDNYMQWPEHVENELAERDRKNKIKLPSSVFASEVEEDVGMLNKAAPVSGLQLHLDPDVVAAMDDDFDYSDPENQLEDNFIELANSTSNQDLEHIYNYSDTENSEADDIVSSNVSENYFNEEETKSRFTNYSMTSSVMRRNDQLTLLDERFEKIYVTYDDTELGAIECEEIEGHIPETSNILLQYADEFEKSQKREQIGNYRVVENSSEKLSEDEHEEELINLPVAKENKWDCESILSTYSNIYNHPKLIEEPKKQKIMIDKRTGVPKNILCSNKLTTKSLNKLNEQNIKSIEKEGNYDEEFSAASALSTLSLRPKNETLEEKKERKKQLKEYRKERRTEKKLNSEAFKTETKRQAKISVNNRNNVQGNKIL